MAEDLTNKATNWIGTMITLAGQLNALLDELETAVNEKPFIDVALTDALVWGNPPSTHTSAADYDTLSTRFGEVLELFAPETFRRDILRKVEP